MLLKRLLPLSLVAVLATSACTFQLGEPLNVQPTSETSVRPDAPQNGDGPAVEQPGVPTGNSSFSDAEVTQEINDAVTVIDTYWKTHWNEFFTGTYTPPTVRGSYSGDDPNRFTCSGELAAAMNAYYCINEDYVAWDFNLMRDGYAEGDAWIYLVVAHEWAHAIQNRLNDSLVSVAGELQADCLAGAVLYGSTQDGTLQWEPGDTAEISAGLTTLGDESPWADPSSHGDSIERVSAFGKGRIGGVVGCLNAS
ncbi:neutral zinc metallopeptidase [Actinocorallia sp. A-T 12471]|uniref:neutral zinc metallopeptidase n=1 Tax=Actinocorallia sp. A-T 12471 TaxID=3089813 RepID=UPI0029D03FEA|nr:neutral zinc metallopeptidase [Actinocorallia sp. A-T 12471]MDX6744733.1 neutral zinc metallopeptidase [Actinocorallia sp. A-T 12471]